MSWRGLTEKETLLFYLTMSMFFMWLMYHLGQIFAHLLN